MGKMTHIRILEFQEIFNYSNLKILRNMDRIISNYKQNKIRNANLGRIIQFVKLDVLISACYV